MNKHYKPYSFYSSPSNFDSEVQEQFHLPNPVEIFDSTIRKLMLTPGVRVTLADIDRISRLSAEIGLTSTVLNLHWWGSADPEPYSLGVFSAFHRTEQTDLTISSDVFNGEYWQKGVAQLAELAPRSVAVDLPIPDVEGHNGHDLSAQLQKLERACENLRGVGIEPTLGVLDVGRAHPEALRAYIETGVAGGCTRMLVHDSASSLSPEAMKLIMRRLRGMVGEMPTIIHAHNDCGLADTVCLAAVTEGAHPDVSIGGVSYRGGFAKLEVIAAALTTLYGVELQLDWDKIQELSRYVDRLVPASGFRGVTGERAFLKEATAAFQKSKTVDGRAVSCSDSLLSAEAFGAETTLVWGANLIANTPALTAKLGLLNLDVSAEGVRAARRILTEALAGKEAYPYWITDDEACDLLVQHLR
ncbi:hypothetical protein [Microbacterium sp. USHLN186]|uniref:hypothetical protein n=1 Tax=Microbacterium sp. USHLN186 TaxID=3081286 RepID=UPI003017B9A4